MVDFICMGLLDMWWSRIDNYKMKKIAHSGIRTGTFRLRHERSKRWAITGRADKYRSPKVGRILPECAINSYLYRVVDVIKCFDVLYILILITLYGQQTS